MPGKSQIADRIAARGWSRSTAGTAVDAVLEEITAALAAGERVTLTGFGTFEAAPRAARTARNPRTGASVAVAATTVARFHPGAALRARVSGGAAPEPGALAAAEPVDTTATLHRAKGADEVKVEKPTASTKQPKQTAKAAEKAKAKAAEKKADDKAATKAKTKAKAKAAEKAKAKAAEKARSKAKATSKSKPSKRKK